MIISILHPIQWIPCRAEAIWRNMYINIFATSIISRYWDYAALEICYIFFVLFHSLFLFISHFLYPDILCYSNYCFSDLRAMSYFATVAIVPAAQALTMVSIQSKLRLRAIYLTCIKLMICNDARTLYFMHHETRVLSYCCDVALLREFWPMGAQLPLKAALPLAERIATASGRCSETGPGD